MHFPSSMLLYVHPKVSNSGCCCFQLRKKLHFGAKLAISQGGRHGVLTESLVELGVFNDEQTTAKTCTRLYLSLAQNYLLLII